jgi:uracil-DNA glycosylase
MDRREAMLRELNLYPQWVRRDAHAPKVASPSAEAKEEPAQPDVAVQAVPVPVKVETHIANFVAVPATRSTSPSDGTASHSAMPSNDNGQVAGYPINMRGELSGLAWPELKQKVRGCTACKLRAGCTQTVFGVGDEKADWLFVGEGPGADEDARGEPFVGQAGKLLDNMLMAIKLKRGHNVYIANIVKCRPPGNRNPEADEIATCMPYLRRQIELIQPRMIVALGKVASNALLGRDATLASLRGKLHDYCGIPLIVTYHPAYLLRSPTEKAKAWQDLKLAVKTMEREI